MLIFILTEMEAIKNYTYLNGERIAAVALTDPESADHTSIL
jgi:hypothetical protein